MGNNFVLCVEIYVVATMYLLSISSLEHCGKHLNIF